jgi:hypothetical protein
VTIEEAIGGSLSVGAGIGDGVSVNDRDDVDSGDSVNDGVGVEVVVEGVLVGASCAAAGWAMATIHAVIRKK